MGNGTLFRYIKSRLWIRTVQIELGEEPVICNFNVDSILSTPVLYSDNDYRITNSNSVSFLIPANPPTKMSFSYGTNKTSSSSLNVTAVFWNEEQNFYFTQTNPSYSQVKFTCTIKCWSFHQSPFLPYLPYVRLCVYNTSM